MGRMAGGSESMPPPHCGQGLRTGQTGMALEGRIKLQSSRPQGDHPLAFAASLACSLQGKGPWLYRCKELNSPNDQRAWKGPQASAEMTARANVSVSSL